MCAREYFEHLEPFTLPNSTKKINRTQRRTSPRQENMSFSGTWRRGQCMNDLKWFQWKACNGIFIRFPPPLTFSHSLSQLGRRSQSSWFRCRHATRGSPPDICCSNAPQQRTTEKPWWSLLAQSCTELQPKSQQAATEASFCSLKERCLKIGLSEEQWWLLQKSLQFSVNQFKPPHINERELDLETFKEPKTLGKGVPEISKK